MHFQLNLFILFIYLSDLYNYTYYTSEQTFFASSGALGVKKTPEYEKTAHIKNCLMSIT